MSAQNGKAAGVPDISVARMVEDIVGCKWSLGLLELSAAGVTRPAAMQRACPGLSAKVMNERLKKMVRFGILERVACGEKPPFEVHYRMTAFGKRFCGLLSEVRRLQEEIDRGAPPPRHPPEARRA
ncbi:MAG: winged helix-turn-helix transcriptional regulator [Desulfobacterales bacterium]